MKIEIDITPEEFKDLFVPGKTQQQFFEQFWTEWNKNMMGNFAEMYSNLGNLGKRDK